ncbi:MAG: type II toxin-antitoxin system VapC family toxin [Burkholderiaceae bacterium]|nr:type II toxin-antitoxin system VapC family toxin [Burkholderiaceae bacterium]
MLLLDSCTLLWWLTDDKALAPDVRRQIGDASLPVFVSVVSLWEILVKHSLGKIGIASGRVTPYEFLESAIAAAGFAFLDLRSADVRHASALPFIHADPFDRMLICQAIERGLTLVTPDRAIRRYPIKTLWD